MLPTIVIVGCVFFRPGLSRAKLPDRPGLTSDLLPTVSSTRSLPRAPSSSRSSARAPGIVTSTPSSAGAPGSSLSSVAGLSPSSSARPFLSSVTCCRSSRRSSTLGAHEPIFEGMSPLLIIFCVQVRLHHVGYRLVPDEQGPPSCRSWPDRRVRHQYSCVPALYRTTATRPWSLTMPAPIIAVVLATGFFFFGAGTYASVQSIINSCTSSFFPRSCVRLDAYPTLRRSRRQCQAAVHAGEYGLHPGAVSASAPSTRGRLHHRGFPLKRALGLYKKKAFGRNSVSYHHVYYPTLSLYTHTALFPPQYAPTSLTFRHH